MHHVRKYNKLTMTMVIKNWERTLVNLGKSQIATMYRILVSNYQRNITNYQSSNRRAGWLAWSFFISLTMTGIEFGVDTCVLMRWLKASQSCSMLNKEIFIDTIYGSEPL